MPKDIRDRWTITEISLSVFVLCVLFFYTYGVLVAAPYAGFHYNPANGEILAVYVEQDRQAILLEGDTLIRVGDVYWRDFRKDSRLRLFEGVKVGDTVELVIRRQDQELTIPWKFPGFNRQEFNRRFFNIWWLPYVYWIFGTITLLLIRPRDTIRRLLVAADYLTGLFLIFGSLSAWHLWESSILLHVVTWLMLPVYLHLHWLFPKSLSNRSSKKFALFFYAVSCLLALAEIFQLLPKPLYTLAFLLALLGSAVLLLLHFVRRPQQRREVALLCISMVLVIVPFIAFLISGVSSGVSYLTFLALPFMPLSYFYVIYRNRIGGLELRANRLVSAYAFLIILGTGLLLLLEPATLLPFSHEALTFLTIIFTLLTTFLCTMAFPTFQAFVEQHLLGIKLPYENLQETYSSRIAATVSMPSLLLLLEELFASLLVRQFAFMQLDNGHLKALLVHNVSQNELPLDHEIGIMTLQRGKYIPKLSPNDKWMCLILPLQVGDNLIGFWLLGRRDPDDHYSAADIPILQSLANQTAIALSNILHAVQLKKIYQSGLERYEGERMRLALDLHDSVLNELAVLRNDLSEVETSSRFQASYQQVTHRLREIVSGLRPPMLIYGLKPAITEFADNLMERGGDRVRIEAILEAAEERIPEQIEIHLYRIVQEACENSLRYADPKTISIYGSLAPRSVDLHITDDGRGFEAETKLELGQLLADHHFGLAGMIERAYLIDANIHIDSSPNSGTKIHLTWTANMNAP